MQFCFFNICVLICGVRCTLALPLSLQKATLSILVKMAMQNRQFWVKTKQTNLYNIERLSIKGTDGECMHENTQLLESAFCRRKSKSLYFLRLEISSAFNKLLCFYASTVSWIGKSLCNLLICASSKNFQNCIILCSPGRW